jgi:hypothetical protein
MLTEQLALVPGFNSYFAFSKARGKKKSHLRFLFLSFLRPLKIGSFFKGGYSGVATYCRTAVTPVSAEEGLTGQLVRVSSLGFAGRGQSPYL